MNSSIALTRAGRLAAPAVLALAWALAAGAARPAAAQDLASFERRTTVHVLPNGWTFILVRRPVAPVFSFATVADVGSAQEVPGITGLAHMFEHMAFKGTPNLGTTDWPAEEKALAEVERGYQAWQAERFARHPDEKKLAELRAAFERAQEAAGRYVVKGAFDGVIQREGGVGVNASTGADSTEYYYSLPANKVELFAFLESERFFHPVFREFYQERDVVQDERRLSTDSRPSGRLLEQFLATAYVAHTYKQPTVGYMSDLQSFTRTDAEEFYRTWYAPANLVTAIVGDIDPKTLVPLLDRYFGRIPARPTPPPLRTVEPPQAAEKSFVIEDPSEPLYLEGYHKPAETSPDQPVYDAIQDILANGRTSRLYRSLVRDKKLAVDVSFFATFPGTKYPNTCGVFVVNAQGVGHEPIQAAARQELERLKTADVTDEELARAKTRAKADLVRSLASNQGLASQLAEYQRLYGDWRELFRYLDRLEAVTKADVRRVATQTFVASNRTVGRIVRSAEAPGTEAPGAEAPGAEAPGAEAPGKAREGRP